MFVSLPFSGVAALDAGDRTRALALHAQSAHGQALLRTGEPRAWRSPEDKVYVGTIDGRLVALDAGDAARCGGT